MGQKLEKTLMGRVGVDSGLLSIGDPCYETDKHFTKEIYGGWHKFCDTLTHRFPGDALNVQHQKSKPHVGRAVVFGGFGGDGTYDVYAMHRKGIIEQVIIDFVGQDND